MRIDLNADLGESFGPWTLGHDAGVIAGLTSVNVACGYHAGDPRVMRDTVRLARNAGAAIGAHPSFPDLQGFGRRPMTLAPDEVEDMVLYQIGALAGIAAAEGLRLQHVKPHGALYNMAAREVPLARAIARAVRAFDRSLLLFAPPGTELLRAGEAAGLRVVAEGFADRAYQPDGSLIPRGRPGAVIHDVGEVIARGVRMARDGVVQAVDGSELPMRVETICTHGDTPGAPVLTRELRLALERAGIVVHAAGGPPLGRG